MALGLALALVAGVLLAPWQFTGEVFIPGSREPDPIVMPGHHYRPLFLPPAVDPQALGLPATDERFQASLSAEVDSSRMAMQAAVAFVLGLVVGVAADAVKKRRPKG